MQKKRVCKAVSRYLETGSRYLDLETEVGILVSRHLAVSKPVGGSDPKITFKKLVLISEDTEISGKRR